MDPRWLLNSALLIFLSTVNAQLPQDYRLANSLENLNYTLNIVVTNSALNGSETTFKGESVVTFQLMEASAIITIHSSVNTTSYNLTSSNGTQLSIVDSYNSATEIVTLRLTGNSSNFSSDTYTLRTIFEGSIDDQEMHGLYRSEYKDENNMTQYLLATQFESTYARRVFPCFDEPRFKAYFTVNINYPAEYSLLGNRDPVITANTTNVSDTITSTFTTPKMSTYLLAFVISNFNCTQSTTQGNAHQVCSRRESAADRALALETSETIMAVLDNITDISYNQTGITKMQHVAIPDFSAGAMENWGLITYREARLLWNTKESSMVDGMTVVTIVAHELTHMWFGNLVTLDWWDYTFLNEGFARFYQYFAAAKAEIYKDWEMDKLFNLQVLQSVLEYDAKEASSVPVTKASFNATEVSNKFDSISYDKGACLLRMLQDVMGEANFTSGIRSYLQENRLSSVKPSNLWESLEKFKPSSFPTNVSLTDVMANWIDRRGFPVLTASLNGSKMTISQSHFNYISPNDDTQWYVPISYTSSNESKLAQYEWLLPGTNLTLTVEGVNWVILNHKGSGYYRVNYDTYLWEKINEVLHSNASTVDVLDRSQLVDDLLNLARARHLDYALALKIVHYLKHETEFYPWYSALTAFDYLFKVFEATSPVGMKLRAYVTDLSESIHNTSLQLNVANEGLILRRSIILEKLNRLTLNHTTDFYLKSFEESINSNTSVNKHIRSVVYCKALKHGDKSDSYWNYLWNRYLGSQLAAEQVIILRALGCTTNQTTLINYLNETISNTSAIRRQDVLSAWSGVISNPDGKSTALDFFIQNHKTIHSLKIKTASLVKSLGVGLTSMDKLNRFAQIADEEGVDPEVASVVRTTVEAANSTLRWKSIVRAELEAYFNSTLPSPVQNTTVPQGSGVPVGPGVQVGPDVGPPVSGANATTAAAPTVHGQQPSKPPSGSSTSKGTVESVRWIWVLLSIVSIYVANI